MLSVTPKTYDLIVIGGGINGTGIAADAAGRDLSVMLCEQNDLASATSSASSKLIHGGLRYLEHYEFRLVKEALAEREVLLRTAPHLVQPLRFTLPHRPHLRPYWMIRMGLFMYDNLTRRVSLPGTAAVKFGTSSPLKGSIRKGLQYSDCWVDDARLVVTNALRAQNKGATIKTRTKCVSAKRLESENIWQLTLEDTQTKEISHANCRVLVNAAGPWVADFIKNGLQRKPGKGIRLIKGSHIIVPKFHDYPGAFILQNEDNRIVFALPYMEKFHLIGTTDKEYKGDPSKVSIDEEEKSYLLSVVNAHFCRQLAKEDIVGSFSGVRPLCDDESSDPSAVTRDYTIELESDAQHPPLLSVYGGKLTTYRKLANAAMEKLKPIFPTMKGEWTQHESLPGSTSAISDYKQIKEIIANIFPWLEAEQLQRFSKAYGLNTLKLLNGAKTTEDLGYHFGEGLYQREVDYLTKHEWAVTAEDILWRRTKLGLSLTEQEQLALIEYLAPQSDNLKRA